MPVYVFKCEKCDTQKDIVLPIDKRNDKIDCEDCKQPLQRLVTTFSLHGMDNLGRSK